MESFTSIKLPHYHIMDYLSHNEIYQIYYLNQSFRSLLINTQEAFEAEYTHYYNVNNKKKLKDILSIISSDSLTYPNTPSNSLKDIIYKIVYGKIINKILQLNRISVFKCILSNDKLSNVNQLCHIIQQINYSKSIIITIEDDNNDICLKDNEFVSIIHCIKNQMAILDVSICFNGNNTFGYVRNLNRFNQLLTTKQSKSYFHFQNMFYNVFKASITNIKMSYQDFDENNLNEDYVKYKVDSFDLTLAFDPQHNYELSKCMSYLKKIIISSTMKIISFQAIDYISICDFILEVKPKSLSLAPYKDLNKENCICIMESLSSYCLDSINLINITNYPFESIDKVMKSQSKLLNLRIGGMLNEDTMKQIISFYLNNKDGKYQLKHLSLNGRINVNREWCDLICKVLSNKYFESFHIDCFFNKDNEDNKAETKQFMLEIANAFYLNDLIKSFTIRNSVRVEKDDFIDALKGLLKEKNYTREDIVKKFKKYAII